MNNWVYKLYGKFSWAVLNGYAHIATVHTSELDAALISAAPDLLAAAQRALDWYEPRLVPGEAGPICNQLRTAIAKATTIP